MCLYCLSLIVFFFFFFNDTATPEIYTLSLHDALPIFGPASGHKCSTWAKCLGRTGRLRSSPDRKSTRLNSSHLGISYAVFCLKKKKQHIKISKTNMFKRHVANCVKTT